MHGNKADKESLAKILKSSASLKQKPMVLVVADENVPLKFVTEVVDLCRLNNLEDFRLQAR